ncbi:MAG: CHRD domain-containing protein [Trueperaceae bacterium]|nr:MAG: CHRD domain-containing protein [Trueperaceae bacterium]
MKAKMWLVVLSMLACALAGSAVAQMSFEEIIMARDEAMNAGEVDVALSLYADDATYSVILGPGQEPVLLAGKEAIYERLAPFAKGNVGYDTTVFGVIGNTARALTKWSFDGLRADGFAYLDSFEEFVFEEGKIVEHTMTTVKLVPLEPEMVEMAEVEQPVAITFTATLTGDAVIPPVETAANGKATAILVGDLLTITGDYVGLSSEVYGRGSLLDPSVTVHHAVLGADGPIVRVAAEEVLPGLRTFALLNDGGKTGSFHGMFKLSEEQIHDLKEGLFYLVVHTELEPRGELRGQFVATTKLDLTSQDLAGVWRKQSSFEPTYVRFNVDGTFEVASMAEFLDTNPIELGVFELDDTRLTFTTEDRNPWCPAAKGTYSLMLTVDEQLRFFPHEDGCPYRLGDLSGALWLPVEQ